ncbi:MAG: hypothetical protein HY868_05185 [Chloroflexi bacterium]|nr:hypothetical protein [Chloroflexota bacterium]
MKSHTIASFWKGYDKLSQDVQHQANKAYRLWRADPAPRGLHFKRVSNSEPIYSARIGRDHRAVGLLEGDTVYWFFIGSHDEYDRVLRGKAMHEEKSAYASVEQT